MSSKITHSLEIKLDNSTKFRKEIETIKNMWVKTGLWGDGGTPETNMAYLGAIQEYGVKILVTDKMRRYLAFKGLHLNKNTTHITIPPRSFMRETLDSKGKELGVFIAKTYVKLANEKKDMSILFTEVGLKHQQDIKNQITKGEYKENHPFTIAQKSSDKPLIGMGGGLHLRINYKIGKGTLEKPSNIGK